METVQQDTAQQDTAYQLLTSEQVAHRYQVPTKTVAHWRTLGKGPAFVRVGDRLVRYRLEDLEAFEQQAA